MRYCLLVYLLGSLVAIGDRPRAPDKPGRTERAASPAYNADQAAEPERLASLIRDLDSARFAVREHADRDLSEIGLPAMPSLLKAIETGSPEVRSRAQRIAVCIQERILVRDMARFCHQHDDQLDMEQGMLLLNRVGNPLVTREFNDERLDALAERVRQRLGESMNPARCDPRQVVDTLCQVLFVEVGFAGNMADYNNPENSLLDRVLETHLGLPIMLSHVMISVGDRLGVPIVGLQIPGRYMVKYDGSRAPEGFPRDDIIVDPFNGGKILTVLELADYVSRSGFHFSPEEHLSPSSCRASLARMAQNLRAEFLASGDWRRSSWVAHFQELLRQSDPKAE